jgi:hypothetical protein
VNWSQVLPVIGSILAGFGVGSIVSAMVAATTAKQQRDRERLLRAQERQHDLRVRQLQFTHESRMRRADRLREDLLHLMECVYKLEDAFELIGDLVDPAEMNNIAFGGAGPVLEADRDLRSMRSRLALDPHAHRIADMIAPTRRLLESWALALGGRDTDFAGIEALDEGGRTMVTGKEALEAAGFLTDWQDVRQRVRRQLDDIASEARTILAQLDTTDEAAGHPPATQQVEPP